MLNADVKQQYGAFMAGGDVGLWAAPASSATSERVLSKAGLIIRPTRLRLARVNIPKLVFRSCNEKLSQ